MSQHDRIAVREVVDLSHELFDGMPNIGRTLVSFGAIYTYAGMREVSEDRLSSQGNHPDQLVGKSFLFVALPLKMRNGTGSPVRAVALVT
jgi:kynurenine formamidase